MSTTRIEKDSMGEMQVPVDALYGAQTARAVDNFPISGQRLPRAMIRALGLIKQEAAKTNYELGLLDQRLAVAIIDAAEEVILGTLDDHFPVDIYQTGSGTSSNMNTNEVIANRASQLLDDPPGHRSIHPNDHVNLGQSSNDVFPTAIHIAAAEEIVTELLPVLASLEQALNLKTRHFNDIVKVGRTHLQDAVPIRMGQVFSGYARQVELSGKRLQEAVNDLLELPLGGTAIGTGLNAHPEFASQVIRGLAAVLDLPFKEARNHFEAQAAKDAVVQTSGTLRTVAVSLFKIANDIRHLGSGPRCGIGELILPPVQPGSSIMPGKVNPVMAESLMQVCAQVVGNDSAISLGGLAGNFELNVMMPLMAHNLTQSVRILATGAAQFHHRCIEGLEADRERCKELMEQSLALVTALAPAMGYDAAAAIAKTAWESGRSLREVALEQGGLSEETLDELLQPLPMTQPGIPGKTDR